MIPSRPCHQCGADCTSLRALKYCSRECVAASQRGADDRIWDRVAKADGDACWEWTGPVDWSGYGKFRLRGRHVAAHRAMFIITYGPVPNGMFVCHRCDNPRCVRPDHLFLGTPRQNWEDACKKGRITKQPNKKISASAARLIRDGASSKPPKTLAAEFGVSEGQVRRIVNHRRWRRA